MKIFELWSELPPYLRYGVAVLLLSSTAIVYLVAERIWIWGGVAGLVLLLFAGPSDSEKKGYRF